MNRTTNLLMLAAGLLLAAGSLRAQTPTATPTPKAFTACYVPLSGTVYLVGEPNTPTDCVRTTHIKFRWTDGPPGWDYGVMQNLLSDHHTQYVRADGSRGLSGDLSAGGFRITGLGPAQGPGDAVSAKQAIKTGDAAGGDLAGTYPDPTVDGLQGRAVSATPPADGNVLTFNVATSTWEPKAPPTVNGTPDNTPGALVQRDATNGGFAAGPVQLTQLSVSGKSNLGQGAVASGNNSTAIGANTNASGQLSTAIGVQTAASADFSMAMGTGTKASGLASTALGLNTTASGERSTAMGSYASTNLQPGAFVYGDQSTIGSLALVTATAPNQFVVRASGGLHFRTAPDLSTGCDVSSGALSCTGMIQSGSGGYKFPDGSILTSATGAVGPQGPPGPAGISGWEIVRGDLVPIEGLNVAAAKATCPEGKKVIGGGFDVGRGVGVGSSFPASDERTWFIDAVNTSPVATSIRAHAICAAVN